LIGALGALLVWQIATRSFAAYLAVEAPSTALTLRPNEPTALVALADAALNPRDEATKTSVTRDVLQEKAQRAAGDPDRIGGWAEVALKAATAKLSGKEALSGESAAPAPLADEVRATVRARAEAALAEDPLNARALRILGQLADASGDQVRAARLMRAAADRSRAESVAVYWMLQQSFATKDYARAASFADTLLRKRPQLMAHAIPVLGKMAESVDEGAVGALQATLAQDPPWRRSFFASLPGGISDARTPLNLLLSLESTAAPPTTPELAGYLRFLIDRKLYELAYYTWLQFLPADELGRIGYLANPGFEKQPSGLPFDWVIQQGTGATIDIAALPNEADARALRLDLGPGRADFRGVTQLLMLTPGTYRLAGKMKGESRGQRGLQWTVRCAGKGGPSLGEAPMFVGVALAWTEFDLTFTVPDTDCRAQELRLALAARSASEQLVSGSVWYDDMQIARLPAGAAAAP
jgi:hypothetical protein